MFKFSASTAKFWACFSVIACLASAVPSPANAQVLEAMPEFEVGDKWTYRSQNKGDRKEPYLVVRQAFKSEAGSGWYYFDTKNPDARNKLGVTRFDYKRGDAMEAFAFDPSKKGFKGSRINNWQPFDNIFQLPLSVGKKYDLKWPWTDGYGFDEFKVEVEEFGKVKTEAGEFDAYRVKLTGFWTRTGGDPNGWTGSGRAGRIYWYAPSVKQVVKTETFSRHSSGAPWNEFVSELVKWEPKAALDSALTAAPPAPAASAPQ